MQPFVIAPDGSGTGVVGPVLIQGGVPMQLFWCATARDRVSNAGDSNSSSVRERDLVYMRGLKERISIVSNNAASWKWRRICFTAKGINGSFAPQIDALETSSGWVRLLTNQFGTNLGNLLRTLVFKGTFNQDWNDVFTANLDTNRISVKYDKVRILASGNQSGKYFDTKLWHPMNHNLQYSNDENGEGESGDNHSTVGRAGMGDYYIMDFFASAAGDSADRLFFGPEATLYWHER